MQIYAVVSSKTQPFPLLADTTPSSRLWINYTIRELSHVRVINMRKLMLSNGFAEQNARYSGELLVNYSD